MRFVLALLIALVADPAVAADAPPSLNFGLDFCFQQSETGERLLDSAHGYDMRPVGNTTSGNAIGRTVRTYPGGANYFQFAQENAALSVRNSSDWTLAALVKPAADDTNYTIFANRTLDGSKHFFLYGSGSGNYKVSWKDSTDYLTLACPGLVVDQWSLIVCWYSATTQTLSMSVNDGTPVMADASDCLDPLGITRIGSEPGNLAVEFKGQMSTVAKWNRVLIPGERTGFYANGTFATLNTRREMPPINYVEIPSISDPVARTDYAMTFDSRNREHQFKTAHAVNEPFDLLNGNVISLHHADGSYGNSAMRFLKPGMPWGIERGAIGRGAAYPFNSLFIEASDLSGPEAEPELFRFVQTGKVGGTYLNHVRLEIRPDGSFNWLGLGGSNQLRIDLAGNVIVGGTLTTDATNGFFRLPSCEGTPTGAAEDGSMVRDSTNHKVYFRSGGNWISLN